MSEKVEKAALLNRLRVQKHRENKRRKVEPTISHVEKRTTCSDGQKDERISVQLGNWTVHRSTDDPSAVDPQAQRIESCEDVPLFGNINSGGHSILSDAGDSKDDEVDSKLLVPEEVDSIDDAGITFIDKLKKWASKDVAYIKVDSLLKILKPHHPEVPLSSNTLLKTELQLSHKIRSFNASNPSDKLDLPSKDDHMNLFAVKKAKDIPHEVDETVFIEPMNTNSSLEADNDFSYILVTKKDLLDFEDRIAARVDSQVSEAMEKIIEREVNPRFDKIEGDLKELKAITVGKSQNEKNIVTLGDFTDLYNLDLPFQKFEDFSTFDILIRKNARDLGSDLKKVIKTTSNHKVTPEENCKMTMRRFLENDVISLFTAKKPTGNKPIFKNTAFFSCMLDALLDVHKVDGKQILDEKILVSHVGTIINIARTTVGKTAVPKNANGIIGTSAPPVAK